jgi:hypothetical protein
MEGAASRARRRGKSRRPELYALLGTGAWWWCFFALGALAATVLYGALFAASGLRLALAARRSAWGRACARAGRGLALATALTSAILIGYGLFGGDSRRVTEDLMELGLIHLALGGPLFLTAAFLAWLGRQHEAPARLYYAAYPGSWVLLLLLGRFV